MALAIQCPGCRSRLGVTEAMAGKKVKCPKCGKLAPVPGDDDFEVVEDDFEVVEDESEAVEDEPKKRPSKARQVAQRNNRDSPHRVSSDEDDEDRHPRNRSAREVRSGDGMRRRRKRDKANADSNSLWKIIVGIIVAIFVLLGVAAKFMKFGRTIDNIAGGTPAATPINDWITYSGDRFTLSFPRQPNSDPKLVSEVGQVPNGVVSAVSCIDGGCHYAIITITMNGGIPNDRAVRQQMFNAMSEEMQRLGQQSWSFAYDTSVSGFQCKGYSVKTPTSNGICRIVITNNRMVIYAIEGDKSFSIMDERVFKFMQSLKLQF